MRLSDDVKHCLGFLITKRGPRREDTYEGTAFFISVPSEENPEYGYYYLVTAKHVILDEKGDPLSDMWLRVNTKDGRREDIRLKGNWVTPKRKGFDIDIAVMLIEPLDSSYFEWFSIPYEPPKIADVIRENGFADERIIKGWTIGIGDELRIVGLFSERTGRKRNIPIVRSGIIAAMPEEPLKLKMERRGEIVDVEFNASLAEVRSLGGLSGSPVFVMVEPFRRPELRPDVNPELKAQFHYESTSNFHNIPAIMFLFGLVRGHWDYKKQSSFVGADKPYEQVNMGIAYVTPIQDVIDLLYEEGGELMRQRQEGDKNHRSQSQAVATEDKAKPSRMSENEGVTQEGFEDALKRASRKIPEPQGEPSK